MTSRLADPDRPPCPVCGSGGYGAPAIQMLLTAGYRRGDVIERLASSGWYSYADRLLDHGGLCNRCSSALLTQSLLYSDALLFAALATRLDGGNSAARNLVASFGGLEPSNPESLREWARDKLRTNASVEPAGTFEALQKEVLLRTLPAPATHAQLQAELDHWSKVRAGLSDLEKARAVASGLVDTGVGSWMIDDMHDQAALATLATHKDFRTARSAVQKIDDREIITGLLRRDDVRYDLHEILADTLASCGDAAVLRELASDPYIGSNAKLKRYIESRAYRIEHAPG